jgi:hypothetical protein
MKITKYDLKGNLALSGPVKITACHVPYCLWLYALNNFRRRLFVSLIQFLLNFKRKKKVILNLRQKRVLSLFSLIGFLVENLKIPGVSITF